MSKGTRITMTKRQSESPMGKRLVDLILDMCHDGDLLIDEIRELHALLMSDQSGIPAVEYLRPITREAIADGRIDQIETYKLKVAFERVVPKSIRGIVTTHLSQAGLPSDQDEWGTTSWHDDAATDRQLQYIVALGGKPSSGMTKGQASNMIDELLERRPPTPRQMMVLRFFDRLDLATKTKEQVSLWLDRLYISDERFERAWDRFKLETDHDRLGNDPTVVPVGAYCAYLSIKATDSSGERGLFSWFSSLFRRS